ncbi:MAG: DNA polymerase III subunit gamma/tau [Porphyromonadaceae bacterium]|nr:DNA polymerase III subunit gamma/tau [Porphyromonadaceae bacterium]
MSGNYIVSARKYRPDSFATIVGQEAMSATLRTAVLSGKTAHAYLFCGPRGVGKTTAARVLAKTINCTNLSAEGEACNRCESCRAFEEQRSFNIFELDAASNNSVEDIRTLTEQVAMPPALGRYKVYIIDEVHMLSQAAFNAFLKTLEEPPSYAIFILATTEKHKILPTILSRCQIYDFRRITVLDIAQHLRYVATSEGIEAEEAALGLIAEKADGGMRDALSMFDRIASFSAGHITYANALESLNVLDHTAYRQLLETILAGNYRALLVSLDQILARGFDGQIILSGLATFLRDLLVAQYPETLPLLEKPTSVAALYQELASRTPTVALHQGLKVLMQADQQYRSATNKRLLVELSLLNLISLFRSPEVQPAASTRPQTPVTTQVQPQSAAPASMTSEHRAASAQPQPPRMAAEPASSREPLAHPEPAPQVAKPVVSPLDEELREGRQRFRGLKSRSQRLQSHASVEPREEEVSAREGFDEVMLQRAWMQFVSQELEEDKVICRNIMQQELPRLVAPHIAEVAIVDSSAVMEPIQRELPRIQAYLRRALRHGAIEVRIRAKAEHEQAFLPTTSQDKYEHLKKLNPNVEKLRDTLKLRLL